MDWRQPHHKACGTAFPAGSGAPDGVNENEEPRLLPRLLPSPSSHPPGQSAWLCCGHQTPQFCRRKGCCHAGPRGRHCHCRAGTGTGGVGCGGWELLQELGRQRACRSQRQEPAQSRFTARIRPGRAAPAGVRSKQHCPAQPWTGPPTAQAPDTRRLPTWRLHQALPGCLPHPHGTAPRPLGARGHRPTASCTAALRSRRLGRLRSRAIRKHHCPTPLWARNTSRRLSGPGLRQ